MLTLLLLPAALAVPPGMNLVPLGVGVYLHGKPVRGVVYSATQAAGIAVLSVATVNAYDAALREDDTTFGTWQAVSMGAVTLAAGSYLVSVLDGSRMQELEDKAEQSRAQVRAWDADRAVAVRAW